MVEGGILSAVKQECIQSAQLLEWVFPPPPFKPACSQQVLKRAGDLDKEDSEGRTRSQEDEEGQFLSPF